MQFSIKELDIETVRFDMANKYLDQLNTMYNYATHNYEAWSQMNAFKDCAEEAFKALEAIRICENVQIPFWGYVWKYFQTLPEQTILDYFSHQYDKTTRDDNEFDWRFDNKQWVMRNIKYF